MGYQKRIVESVHFPQFFESLPSLTGKTFAVTGTTSGLGKIAARTVVQKGGRLLMLNRKSSRSAALLEEMTTAFPDAEILAVECDLMSFASTKAAAARVNELCPDGLDVLANNAGVMALEDKATGDGYDVQMQTNHLSHFLLTRDVWPSLQKAAAARGEARVVNHSSVARMAPKKKLIGKYLEKRGGDLGGNGASIFFGGARWLRYNQTKLANCAFTAALHERIQASGSKVKVLVAHPGLSSTELQVTSNKEGGMATGITNVFMRMSQSPEDGAMGLISGMCLAKVESGQFYGPGKGMTAMKGKAVSWPLESFYDNAATRDMLWSKSCEAIGGEFRVS